MASFLPFRALRYSDTQPLAEVTAPPYDVLSDADRSALAARHPHNVVLVDVPVESDGPDRYNMAAKQFAAWLAVGIIERDSHASYYRYTMQFIDETGRTREVVGVFGALEVSEPSEHRVLPHEQTTPKAKTDRLDLTQATNANLSAVWGLSMAPGVGALIAKARAKTLGTFTADDGVHHIVERIASSADIDAIQAAIASAPVVIADGHHRYAISRQYRDEHGGLASHTLTFVVELAADQLVIQPIHRLLNGITSTQFENELASFFEMSEAGSVSPATLADMSTVGALCLVRANGTGVLLKPRAEAFTGCRDLDSERLERALDNIAHTKTYQHGVDNIVAALSSGSSGQYGVLLRSVPIHEIERTANEGLLMPPKSTFFAPKPRTGVVFRTMDPDV